MTKATDRPNPLATTIIAHRRIVHIARSGPQLPYTPGEVILDHGSYLLVLAGSTAFTPDDGCEPYVGWIHYAICRLATREELVMTGVLQ